MRRSENLNRGPDSIRNEGTRNRSSVGVARGQVPGNFRAFVEVAVDRNRGGRRAGPIGLLKAVIAAVEACDHPGPSVAGGRFGLDQGLHLVAPFAAFVAAANAAQIV